MSKGKEFAELIRRIGVEEIVVDPHNIGFIPNVEGPARVLIVQD